MQPELYADKLSPVKWQKTREVTFAIEGADNNQAFAHDSGNTEAY